MSVAGLYIFGLLDGAALLFLTVFFIINLSDLECDYINARTCCDRLNIWVIPELIAHGLITMLLLGYFQWIFFLLNLPLMVWNFYRFINKPPGNLGLYDPAEIHNRSQLKGFLKESMIKLAFHLIFFFLYLYSMISALLADSDEEKAATEL
ncbi:protein cornichon homolog 4-like [Actinia tenebrosa]|uniref:Protein cornichon homolog 4-like n=1 Tax=Actinia tenebrosa TaxID=6105 RepID=A0A6P8HEE5_ACTTE|nr:protein cornichon homolog 4-like [Actinia tenebrosa]XP_031554096.1 protein cornichon homolog 4-like [Actinia tenebrosa]